MTSIVRHATSCCFDGERSPERIPASHTVSLLLLWPLGNRCWRLQSPIAVTAVSGKYILFLKAKGVAWELHVREVVVFLRDLKHIETKCISCLERHRTLWIQVRYSCIQGCIFNLCRVGYTNVINFTTFLGGRKSICNYKSYFSGRWRLWRN